MSKLTHLDDGGAARMVDVSAKAVSAREAVAEARIVMPAAAYAAAKQGNAPKGDVLGVARVAGVMAAKRTWELIPLCHPLALSRIDIEFEWLDGEHALRICATAATAAQTGVEMEALTAASVAALTVYDMVKGIDKGAQIENVRLLSKSGGKSGSYRAVPLARAPVRAAPAPAGRPAADAAGKREAFRAFMTSRRLRATDWAKRAGVPPGEIYAFLTGRSRGIAGDVAGRLAHAAGVRVEDMFR